MDDFPTALELSAAIRSKELSPTEALAETLRRIDERNPAINAVTWRDDEDARRRARAADDLVASSPAEDLPPFCGVPIPIKDLTPVAGWPVTYGSAGASEAPSAESELVVEAFERAGFVLAGRTNTPEFGPITAAENVRYGISRNPWDTDHTPGGSSGGASAATAAGIYPIAHANDGGGSIRIPASCCGLVGLKVGRGRVPALAQAWEGAAVEGVVSHTVADTAAVLDLISGPDPLGWWNAPAPHRPFSEEVGAVVEPLRVAVVTETALGLPTAPACVEAVQRTAAALESAGHQIVDVAPDFHIEEFIGNFITVVNSGLAAYDDMVDWALVEAHNRVSRETAGGIDSITYAKAVAALQRWTRSVNAQWGDRFDVLLTPTMAIEPAPAGQILAEVQADPDGVSPTVLHSVLFTAVFNMNGLPAISLPVHQSGSGLPIGAQLVAGPWQEAQLLRLSAQVEQLLPWNDRHPTLPL
ncbi:MAG: amidase [Actinomycetota bacterium]